jgi:hypothetical protein
MMPLSSTGITMQMLPTITMSLAANSASFMSLSPFWLINANHLLTYTKSDAQSSFSLLCPKHAADCHSNTNYNVAAAL